MTKIIDLHCDTVGEIQAGADIVSGHPPGHIDLERLKKGNVGAQVFACYISSLVPEVHAFSEAEKLIRTLDETCVLNAKHFRKVWSVKDLEEALAEERIAVLPAVENGHAIANDLRNIEKLRTYGTRYMTLTHAKNLSWAASSGESHCDFEGLTVFGKKVIAAMNEMGIIIDLSHVHESTFWAAVELSKRPPIASHSNSATLCPTKRNLKDNQIKAIADKGGMIGINFYPGFLDPVYLAEQTNRCGDLFARLNKIEIEYWQHPPERTEHMRQLSEDLVERMRDVCIGNQAIISHLCHMIDLVGDDFIGFGSDFDGVPALPEGMTGCDVFPTLNDLMREKGFSERRIRKINHDNFCRVLKENP